jgi:threonine dehydrogenase-like Zn-dependent dehydrogenase
VKVDSLWIVEPRKVEIRQVEVGEPAYDEVQIEVKACGVCAWDSYLYRGISAPGPLPYRLGHEGVGIVRKVGAGVKGFKPGDKVFCGGGSNEMMAQVINLKASCVGRIPDHVEDFAKWVLEPTVCVVNLLHLSQINPGDSVALVGAGYMGLLTLQGLLNGSQAGSVTVFEINPRRRAIAESYQPEFCFDPYSPEGQAHIEKIQSEGGADIVIDFAASDSGYELASSLTADNGGKLVLGTWHRKEMKFDGTRWHLSGLTVLNLAPGSNRNFNQMIPRTSQLVHAGVYDAGSLVTHTLDYHHATEMFEMSIDKPADFIKGVITF